MLMQNINHFLQVICCSISGCRTEKSGILIAPGLIGRMLGERHELYIIISLLFHIFRKHRSDLLIGIPALRYPVALCDLLRCQRISLFIKDRFCAPGTQMNFIDVKWTSLTYTTVLHPFGIMETISIHIPNNGCKCRTQLHAEAIRITMLHAAAVSVIDLIFVHHARSCFRHKYLEKAAVITAFHDRLVPVVEFTDHIYPQSIRCICDKFHTTDNRLLSCDLFLHMRPQFSICIKASSGIKFVNIHVILLCICTIDDSLLTIVNL